MGRVLGVDWIWGLGERRPPDLSGLWGFWLLFPRGPRFCPSASTLAPTSGSPLSLCFSVLPPSPAASGRVSVSLPPRLTLFSSASLSFISFSFSFAPSPLPRAPLFLSLYINIYIYTLSASGFLCLFIYPSLSHSCSSSPFLSLRPLLCQTRFSLSHCGLSLSLHLSLCFSLSLAWPLSS